MSDDPWGYANDEDPYTIERAELEHGTVVTVSQEQYTEICDPRGWDTVGTMVYFGRDFTWGDEQWSLDYKDAEEVIRECEVEVELDEDADGNEIEVVTPTDNVIVIPLRFEDRRNDGTVYTCDAENANGVIYVDEATVVKEFGAGSCPRVWGDDDPPRTPLEAAKRCLEGEVENYAMYLEGECYSWSVEHPDDEWFHAVCDKLDTGCGGYLGDLDYVKSEALEAANGVEDAYRKELEKQAEWAARDVLTKA